MVFRIPYVRRSVQYVECTVGTRHVVSHVPHLRRWWYIQVPPLHYIFTTYQARMGHDGVFSRDWKYAEEVGQYDLHPHSVCLKISRFLSLATCDLRPATTILRRNIKVHYTHRKKLPSFSSPTSQPFTYLSHANAG